MIPPKMQRITSQDLLFAMIAVLITAPSVIPMAITVAAPPDDAPMETMELIADDEPAADTGIDTKAEPKPVTGAAVQPSRGVHRQPGVETKPMIEMAPAGQGRHVGEATLDVPPIPTNLTKPSKRDRRLNRFGLRDETTSTQSTHPPRPTYPVDPTYPLEQSAPAQTYKTIRIEPIYTTARTAHPVNRRSGSFAVNPDDPLNNLRRRDVVRDFVNESSGNVFVGFGRNNYVRRPKYEHRSGFGADYRDIRTNQDFFALPRHGRGQDLFDPRRGRVIHGIKRRDGSVDYYDPVTGRWILTDERRR